MRGGGEGRRESVDDCREMKTTSLLKPCAYKLLKIENSNLFYSVFTEKMFLWYIMHFVTSLGGHT